MADLEARAAVAAERYIDDLDDSITSDFYYDRGPIEAAYTAGYLAGAQTVIDDLAYHRNRERAP